LEDDFDKELDEIRKRKLEELAMSDNTEGWPNKPVEITDAEFLDFIKKYEFTVVDCWAPWCGPCRMLGPVIEELASEYEGKVAFGKLNTDDNQATALAHGIMSIPTLLYFKDGELVDRTTGALPKPVLEEKLQEHL
jgi:thioredoxin 1